MKNKKTKGRQKISMKKIDKKEDRYTTFSKRRAVLYKKASELATECDVDIRMLLLSPSGKPYSFFHPTVDAIVSHFQNPDMQFSDITCLVAANARNEVKKLNTRLEELDIIKDASIAQTKFYDQVTKTRQKGWWESIEQLNTDEVTKFEAWFNAASFNLQYRLNQLENGASTSMGCESFGM